MNIENREKLPEPPKNKKGWPWYCSQPATSSTISKKTNWPSISIVTPSFNQGEFIEETIRSILLQGYPNIEYIVIDGNSSDNSVEIIKKYEPWITYWVSEKDRGQSHAINKGFGHATGEVLGWLNSDDYFARDAFINLILLREKNPDCVAWVGACHKIDTAGNSISINVPRIGNKRQIANWAKEAWFSQPSCLFDANAFRSIGDIEERLEYVMDVELWMRLSDKGAFASTDEVVSYPRLHSEMKTLKDIPMREAEHIFIDMKQDLRDVARARMLRYHQKTMDKTPLKSLMTYVAKRILSGIWNRNAPKIVGAAKRLIAA